MLHTLSANAISQITNTSPPKLDACILIQKQAPHRLNKLSFKVRDHPTPIGFLKDRISDWAYAHRMRRPLEGSPFQKGATPHTPQAGRQKKMVQDSNHMHTNITNHPQSYYS